MSIQSLGSSFSKQRESIKKDDVKLHLTKKGTVGWFDLNENIMRSINYDDRTKQYDNHSELLYERRLQQYGARFPLKDSSGEEMRGSHGKVEELTHERVVKFQKADQNVPEEVEIYQYLQNSGVENIPPFYDFFRSGEKISAMILKKVGPSAYDTYLNRNNPNRRSPSMIEMKIFLKHILRALAGMHRVNVAHLDVKPENCSVAKMIHTVNGLIKTNPCLLDFGCSEKLADHTFESDEYCTSWYRPPELLLNLPFGKNTEISGTEIDMWSLGCTLVEIYTGYPVFWAKQGENERIDLIKAQLKCLELQFDDLPDDVLEMFEESPVLEQLVDGIGTPDATLKKGANISFEPLKNLLRKRINDTQEEFDQFNSLVRRMLQFNPKKRITAEEAFRSPFFDPHGDAPPVAITTKPFEKVKPLAVCVEKGERYQVVAPKQSPAFSAFLAARKA